MTGSRSSIARRVNLACAVLLVISAVASSFIVWRTISVGAGIERNGQLTDLVSALDSYRNAITEAHNSVLLLVNSSDMRYLDIYRAALEAVESERQETVRVAAIAGEESAAEALAAVERIDTTFVAWQREIADRQIFDLNDPATVDVARLREVSPENEAIWQTVGTAFIDAAASVQARFNMSRAEQTFELHLLQAASVGLGVVLIGFAVFMGLLLSRTVSRPLKELAAVTERLRDRDWNVDIRPPRREDEIGVMSRSLEVFRESGRRGEALEAERRTEAERKLAEAEAIAHAVERFRTTATGLLTDLDGAGKSLGGAATSLENVAGTSHAYTTSVSRAAEATGSSVESVASAVEEMSASIREISSQMQNVSRLTRDATGASEAAGRKVAGLQKMSENINSVIGLINGIAGQINLLALNATIESARAGEAGKGFAVVASQVKQLADQTAKATDEITRVINEVQGEVADVVGVIGKIGGSISEVSTNCAAVAAAVEEQSAALDEITQNVTAVSSQTSNVATNVRGVEEKVSETRRVASTVSELSAALKTSSEGLSTTIERFIAAVANDTGATGRAA